MKTTRFLQVLCVACLIAVFAAPLGAASPDEKGGLERQASVAPSVETNVTKSIRVIYDPETGEIVSVPFRDTEVLSVPLAKALTRSTEGLKVFELSNGGKGVHLDGRFQHALMVRVKADGSLETVCTSHSHAAEKFLKAGSAGANAKPRDK
jgi:hypothetical protein